MSKNTPHKINFSWLTFAFLAVLILGIMIGLQLEKENAIASRTMFQEKAPKKIDALLHLLEEQYIHKINQNQLLQQTIDRIKTSEFDINYIPSK